MMWGPALGLKAAALIAEGAVTGLPSEEITLRRLTEGHMEQDAITLPLPTGRYVLPTGQAG